MRDKAKTLARHARWLGAVVLLAFSTAGISAAQDGVPTSIFGEVVDVRVVNLEIVVTEDGERVTGLKPEDFVLTVDGNEVPIEYFTEVHGGAAVTRGDEGDVATLPALAPGTPVGTSYLVFVDDYFMVKARRDLVLRGLIEQLPLLNPEDRMAVVAFNGKKLEMLTSWSQSAPALTRVLEDALERPAEGLKRLAEQRSYEASRRIDREILQQTGRTGSDLDRLDPEEEREANRVADQVERAVLAATSALRSFANPPGRKVMILLAGGWPYNPAQYVTGDFYRSTFRDVKVGDDLFGSLMETANRLSYTLYPVDVPFQDPALGNAEIRNVELAQDQLDLYREREQENRTSLLTIARETGGEAILGGARSDLFERVVADTRSYYWLGFTPTWQGDDSEHKVEVEARRKGLKIRSRKGFSDLSRSTEVSMMVESALILGDAPSAVPLSVQVGKGKRSGFGKVEVPLTVIIPVDELTFLPYEDKFVAETELRVAVQDESGNISDVPVIPLSIALDDMPKERELRRFDTQLIMRKKKHELIVSLYDNASGKILTGKLPVDPQQDQ